jgi:hypothetical protein
VDQLTNNIYKYNGNLIRTIPDANSRLTQLYDGSTGWINQLLDAAKNQ